jgi:hypothetical protein
MKKTKKDTESTRARSTDDGETGCCVLIKGIVRQPIGKMTREECKEKARDRDSRFRFHRGEDC